MKHQCLAVFAAASLSIGTSAANAEGLYFSANLSSTTSGHTIERNASTPGLPVPDFAAISLTENTDISGGLAIGYERKFANSAFYWGAEAFYNLENNRSRNIAGVLVTDVDLESSYGARAIGGFEVTPEFAVYGHVGYTQLDFDLTNSYTFAPPVRAASRSEGGISFGIGAKYNISEQLAVFTEYTKIPDVGFSGIPEVAGGTGRVNRNSLDIDKVSLGVRFSF